MDAPDDKDKESPLKFYVRYSSLAIQMILIILAGAFGGRALDNTTSREFPIFTLSLTILAVITATVYGMREIFKKK
jgi:hypothetical protein